MGSGCPPTPTFSWVRKPVFEPGARARPGRVTHCCFEHAGQNFGSPRPRPPGNRPVRTCGCYWRTSELKQEPEEIADTEHELVLERVCAIDVAKDSGKVCVRVSGRASKRVSKVWDVPARTGAVGELAEHLLAEGIEKVTVESTSDYWRIWFYVLEAAGLSVQLVNARDVKNVPGRPKTDKLDAVWLAKLTEKGLLRPSFVPHAPIRELRDYTRLRIDLTRERSRYWQRLEKLLEDALIKVSAVASTLDTLSVRDMLEALIARERDPRLLATIAYEVPGHDDGDSGAGGQPSADLTVVQRLTEIPGIGPTGAQVILAEIGLDMSRFPTAAHLVSWAKLCPRTIQSGAIQRRGKSGKGNPYLKGALGEAAAAAAKTNTFLGERYRRIVKRRGKLKALVAVARSILVIIWNLLSDNHARFRDLGPDYHATRINTDESYATTSRNSPHWATT